jgi:hypothetical protein
LSVKHAAHRHARPSGTAERGDVAPRAQRHRVFADRHRRGAGNPLHLSVAADVIEMRVAREQDLDVRDLEAQLLDIPAHLGDGRFHTRIDEDVALR